MQTPRLATFALPSFSEPRGVLTCFDIVRQRRLLPFEVQRVFWITDVPQGSTRGAHAHRTCSEALVALNGAFKVRIDNGQTSWVKTLSSPSQGIVIPPLVWCELYDFTPGSVCLCLASGEYDEGGYLRTYDEFQAFVENTPS